MFFKGLAYTFFMEAKGRHAFVVRAYLSVSLLVYGDEHSNLQIFQCSSRTSGHFTHTNEPKNSIQGFVHFKSDFIKTCSLQCFDSKLDFDCSDGVFLRQMYLVVCVQRFGNYWVWKIFDTLNLQKMSSSLVSKRPVWSLIDLALWDLLPQRRRMVSQNTLFAFQQLESSIRPKYCQAYILEFFTVSAEDLRTSAYRECKESSASL